MSIHDIYSHLIRVNPGNPRLNDTVGQAWQKTFEL